MSENRESGLSATSELSNTNALQQIQVILNSNLNNVEKQAQIRKLLDNQVASDSYTGKSQTPNQMGVKTGQKHSEVKHQSNVHEDNNKYYHPHHPKHQKKAFAETTRHEPTRHEPIRHEPNLPERLHSRENKRLAVNNAIQNRPTFLEPFGHSFITPFGRGRRFIGPFDLMDPLFFGVSDMQRSIDRMFDNIKLEDFDQNETFENCENQTHQNDGEETENKTECQKHLKFTSKVVSIGPDGIKRSRVVNGVTKVGKNGKPVTHKKMISCDESGKTITEVFADGSERTTKCPYIKGRDDEDD